jgi:C4-type Zn-finger protein
MGNKKKMKTICPKCGVELNYKAVTLEEIKHSHGSGVMGAYCERCGARLISE